MTFTILPEGGNPSMPQSPPPQPSAAVRPYIAERSGSRAIGIAAGGFAVAGAVGGYAIARRAGLEPLMLAAFVWWVASAITLSLLVKRSTTTAAIVWLFLFMFVGLPVVGYAGARGMAERAIDVISEDFSELQQEFENELQDYEDGDDDLGG
jgi:hypothetical protein